MPARLQVRCPSDFEEFKKESIFQGIHERIEDRARLYPERVALKFRNIAHTYAEMNGLANSLAAEILSASGTGLAQAAILQPNTPELIITMLASLKAHKAYVPLDCNFPKERLRAMLEDAEPVVLLTDDRHFALAEELAGRRVRIIDTSRIKRYPDAPDPRVPCDPLDRAYILYTSGSTGGPKGIVFLHRNLLHTTMCLINELFFSPSDRVTWLHSPSFGSSVVDIYCCLMSGGALYPWDVKAQGFTGMVEWMVQNKLTTFQWIPGAFRQFMRTVPDRLVFEDMRIVVMAGEPLTVREVELFRRHFPPGSHLVNQVGTGESYNYHLYRVDHRIPIEDANVAGGYPVSSERQALILDDAHSELPRGSVGEIAIKSDYMAAGYWRDEALTRAKFIRLGADETPVYLTGDLGKLEPDGCLIHLGRKDFQIKIRGCRVELAEIDHLLAAAPGVADAASWIAKNRLGEDRLVGYVVLEDPSRFNQRDVEEYLGSRLPGYMVPTEYVILDSLPTLPTGKADRRALPNPFERAEARTPTGAPKTAPAAQTIPELFKELLQLDDVRTDTNFLEAGGDSLLTAVLLQRVHQRFGVEIAVDDFLESPTPGNIASLIAMALENGAVRSTSRKSLLTDNRAILCELFPVVASRSVPAHGDLIIVSAGRMGREIFTWAAQAIAAGAPYRIKGFLDHRANALVGYDYEVGILGDVRSYEIQDGDVFIGAIGDPQDKVEYYTPIVERGGRFINLIHPLANIGKNVRLGSGIVLAPFASVTSDIVIGDHVSIGAFSNVGHDAVVGDWCQISSHCGINGRAILGKGVFLGSHACVIPGIAVGDWAFVGAGSVVVRDVEPCVKVFGNPAALIGKVDGPRSVKPYAVDRSQDAAASSTAPKPLPGYLNSQYAASLKAFGSPRELPRAGGWLLERQIPNSPYRDAMGCYPLFCCQNWSAMQADLDALSEDLVSVTLVSNPFGRYTETGIENIFDHVVRFKEHFVVDLAKPGPIGTAHHRKSARQALSRMDIHIAGNPVDRLDDWVRLYDRLIARHGLTGIKAFSREAFRRQLSLPGVVLFLASRDGAVIGANIWIIQNNVAYAHLLAMDDMGYEMRAAYALTHSALQHVKRFAKWADLGGNPGVESDSDAGLSNFKAGWATETRIAFLCGRILQPERYAELTRRAGTEGASYFPAYRSGELV